MQYQGGVLPACRHASVCHVAGFVHPVELRYASMRVVVDFLKRYSNRGITVATDVGRFESGLQGQLLLKRCCSTSVVYYVKLCSSHVSYSMRMRMRMRDSTTYRCGSGALSTDPSLGPAWACLRQRYSLPLTRNIRHNRAVLGRTWIYGVDIPHMPNQFVAGGWSP